MNCRNEIEWAYTHGKHDSRACDWYKNMKLKVGVEPVDATFEDFQRLFKCNKMHLQSCTGLDFPQSCSFPPCNICQVNTPGKYRIIFIRLKLIIIYFESHKCILYLADSFLSPQYR